MNKIKIVVVGCGNMGTSHALAYKNLSGDFEIIGLVDNNEDRASVLKEKIGNVQIFRDFLDAMKLHPDAVSICTYPDTHAKLARIALENNCHVFVEKPIAESVKEALDIVALSNRRKRKVVVGYILRHHPAWAKFIEIARTLGKPLVMRMNLNQQSSGKEWRTHKELLKSMSPIVDCGVHYVDVMCQMTRSKPKRVSGILARLSDEIGDKSSNYGQLQVTFEDGSCGWYEAGWGPMISETAFFVKDVFGPRGSVSISSPKEGSSNIDSHTKTNSLIVHHSELDANGNFLLKDEIISTSDEPNHNELCLREQKYFLKAIRENIDLSDHLEDAVNSLKIVLASDESAKKGQTIILD